MARKAMSEPESSQFFRQVQQLDFAAALRHEHEQAAARRTGGVPLISSWRIVLVWMAIGAVLFGSGLFVGWLAWHHGSP
jgi:hypothetical protein